MCSANRALLIVFSLLSFAGIAFAAEEPVHSYMVRTPFSNHLLDSNEYELSLTRRIFHSGIDLRYGLWDDLEIGTSLTGLMVKTPSLFLKNRIFSAPHFDTVFSGFASYLPHQESEIVGPVSGEVFKGYFENQFLGYAGVNTVYFLTPDSTLEFGLWGFLLRVRQVINDDSLDEEFATNFSLASSVLSFGGAYEVNPNYALRLMAYLPIYARMKFESEYHEITQHLGRFGGPSVLSNQALWLIAFEQEFDLKYYKLGVFSEAYKNLENAFDGSFGMSVMWVF